MSKIIDLTGKKFGRLTVLGLASLENSVTFWHVRCDCGKEKVIRRSNLYGGAKSCGCLKIESRSGYRFGRPPSPIAKQRAELRKTYSPPNK